MARVGVEAAALAGGWLVGAAAHGAWTTGRWWGRSGPRRRRGRRLAGGWLVGARGAGRLGRLAGGRDVVTRVGVQAGGLTRGWLVGAGGASRLGRLAGGGDVVARVGVEAGGLAGGGLEVT